MATSTVTLRAGYEAAEYTSPLRDWGQSSFRRMPMEDMAFTGSVRSLAVSRLRWEVRNNPYLAGLYAKYPEAVGAPTLRARSSDPTYNATADTKFWKWSRRCTTEGDSLETLLGLAIAELLVAGEVFVILLANGRVQLVPAEFCGSPSDLKATPGITETNGVGRNPDGSPAHYRFARASDTGFVDYAKAEVVAADNVIHLWSRDRVAMGRGLPWLLTSLVPARDLAEITRAKTKQIKDASSISGFIERPGAAEFLNQLAGSSLLDAGTTPAAAAVKAAVNVELRPGTFVGLEPGEKLQMLSTSYQATDYKDLIMLMLHAVSTPVGLPVELWFSGLGDVNYSGFKGLGTQWDSRRRHVIRFLEEKLLDRLHFWWASKAAKLGLLPKHPDGDPSLAEWAWRTTAVLDEQKAALAASARLTAGITCHAEEWEQLGKFADEEVQKRVTLWDSARATAGLPPEPCPLSWIFQNKLPDPPAPALAPTPPTPTA